MVANQTRLAKALARAGVASRRRCEALVFSGRVRVNGQTITHPATRIVPGQDCIEVDGRPVDLNEPRRYLLVYKPRGVVSTCADPRGRPTVVSLVGEAERLFPVGRLDIGSEGLVLLTNDGDLALRLTHPRYEVEKTYRVTISDHPSLETLDRIRTGVELEDGKTAPARVEVISVGDDRTILELVIREGRNRQIRRMMEALGHRVLRLKRTAMGPITLGDLGPGKWRELTPTEIRRLGRPVPELADRKGAGRRLKRGRSSTARD